ncbi:hypothetical protein FIBSPDRAFT_868861 [Athelia psychrophila]|uniref:Uncharacterized protein n=1 Tax=Athelia psychrophila TaxID=1759441 RepID=A0A166CP53_9AGAM|nr:hypothetical protein FIBSPDRAFT_868861 [Fibularhizoctonia sp. CBS 109695]
MTAIASPPACPLTPTQPSNFELLPSSSRPQPSRQYLAARSRTFALPSRRSRLLAYPNGSIPMVLLYANTKRKGI